MLDDDFVIARCGSDFDVVDDGLVVEGRLDDARIRGDVVEVCVDEDAKIGNIDDSIVLVMVAVPT